MDLNDLIKEFTQAALSGASKTQIVRTFKDSYKLSNDQIDTLIKVCKFKEKPKKINYWNFYNNPLKNKCKRLHYPFTQVYAFDNFLSIVKL